MAISKTAQVLKYFAQQYQGQTRVGIPRKRLMKMAYLADLLARQYLGSPITDFGYYRDKYGPYDRAIESFIDELLTAGLAETKVEWDTDNETKRLVDKGVPLSFDFTPAESEILRYTAKNYINMPMKELLRDVVYPSPPMATASPKKEPLDMDIVNNSGTEAVGFELEEVLIAEQQIRDGKCATDF